MFLKTTSSATRPRPVRARVSGDSEHRARGRFGWVDSEGRMIAARVDHPGGAAVGALVVAPSVGREGVVSFRTTRALAMRAARAGFVAFSFSWSGQGDSEDLRASDDLAAAWTADLAAVVAEARRIVGPAAPVHIVGLRAGAGFVARLPQTGPGSRVLWEPVSGSAFLKHHRMIRLDSIDVPVAADGMELEDACFTAEQAASLARVRVPRRRSVLPEGVTVRTEADRRAALRIALGAPYFAHVPLGAIDEIVAGLQRGPARPVEPWDGPRTARMRIGGHVVEETCVEVGPSRLPGILTTCPDTAPHLGLLFSAMGSENRFGPARLWATAARALAPLGATGLRVERGGMGEAADPDRATEPLPYTDAGVADVEAAAAVLAGQGLPTLGVGLCAGAWSLLRAVASGAIGGVVAVNPTHWNPDESVYTRAFYDHYHGCEAAPVSTLGGSTDGTAGPRRTARRRLASLKEVASREAAIRFPRVRSALRPEVPVDLVRMMFDPLPAGSAVTLLFGTEDGRIFRGKGGPRAVARARRRGVHVVVGTDPFLDHSLFSRAGRERALAALVAIVRESR